MLSISRSSSLRTKSAPILNVIMVAIYSSLLVVLCYAEERDTLTNRQHSSRPDTRSNSMFDSTDLFIPLIDTKHISNSKPTDESLKTLMNSKLFKKYKSEKVHILSSASASALLSSSTLSVDELPKPQVQKQTPTGATSVLNKKDDVHQHKHQHRNKHRHSKKRHHKVSNPSENTDYHFMTYFLLVRGF